MKIDGLIFGGGTGDSAAAVFRLCEGIEPVIREREEVPRSHIDQSLSGRAAPVVRRLGLAEKNGRDGQPDKTRGKGLRHECDQQLVCESFIAGSKYGTLRLDHMAGPAERLRRDDAQGSGGAGRDDYAGRRDRRTPEY